MGVQKTIHKLTGKFVHNSNNLRSLQTFWTAMTISIYNYVFLNLILNYRRRRRQTFIINSKMDYDTVGVALFRD